MCWAGLRRLRAGRGIGDCLPLEEAWQDKQAELQRLPSCGNTQEWGSAAAQTRMSTVVVGEVAPWLRGLGGMAEDPGSVPTPTWWFTTLYNSNSRGSDAPFWSSWEPGTHMAHMYACKQKTYTTKYFFLKQ